MVACGDYTLLSMFVCFAKHTNMDKGRGAVAPQRDLKSELELIGFEVEGAMYFWR